MYRVIFQQKTPSDDWKFTDDITVQKLKSIKTILYEECSRDKVSHRAVYDGDVIMSLVWDEEANDVIFVFPNQILKLFLAEMAEEQEENMNNNIKNKYQ